MFALRDFSLLPLIKLHLPFKEVLRSVECKFRTDVLGQPIGLIFEMLAQVRTCHPLG